MTYFKPSPAESYKHLTQGGTFPIELNQDEACVVLKCYDHGIDHLTSGELSLMNNIIAKLKDQVWP